MVSGKFLSDNPARKVMPRPRHIGTLVLTLLGALGLLALPLTQSAQASPSGNYEKSVHAKTNLQRAHRDRVALKGAKCLDKFAERQARAMAKRHKIYHQNLGPILKTCKLSTVGENVAYGYPSGKSVVSAWMASPGHKANILTPKFRLIAVGAYRDSRGSWYVSQVFGRSR
jgi:uncharacterized protein YkwD